MGEEAAKSCQERLLAQDDQVVGVDVARKNCHDLKILGPAIPDVCEVVKDIDVLAVVLREAILRRDTQAVDGPKFAGQKIKQYKGYVTCMCRL